MRLELTGRHVEITPTLRRLVDRRLAGLTRMLNETLVSAQVVLTKERFRYRTDVTLHARGDRFLHGVAAADSWDASLTEVTEKLERQAQKLKGKRESLKRRGGSRTAAVPAPPDGGGAEPAPGPRIVRASRYLVKPMSVEEAALEVDGRRGAVIVFRNATTETINVLYRRPDGDLGLIEPEG